jgi:branched-chain amino acid aminotransferase
LVTPELDGSILPGVTRDSILNLTRSWGEFKVSERRFTMSDLVKADKEGRIIEMFGKTPTYFVIILVIYYHDLI